jgi:putative membrane protein
VTLLLVPLLLLVGDPTGLAVEVGTARGTDAPARLLRSGLARAAAGAVPGAVAVCVLLLAVYRTPLIEMSQRSSWLHLAVLTLALVSGLLLLWPVLGTEVTPRRGGAAEWQWSMVAVAGCLAILAAQLRYGDRLLAAEWFLELRWGWIDPVADQRLAGALVAVATVAVLVVAVLLGVRRRTHRGGA